MVLFLVSIAIAAIIPLLKLHWLKRLAMISAAIGGALSLVWTGYEYGLKQKDAMRKELMTQIEQVKSERSAQDNARAQELKSLRDENSKLKSYTKQSNSKTSNDDNKTTESPKKKGDKKHTVRRNNNMEDDSYLKYINTTSDGIRHISIPKEKTAESPIVLEPTWVESGSSVQAISGQIIIRAYHSGQWKTPCEYGEANVLIDTPYKESIQACLKPGLRKTFDYKGKNYFLTLLQERSHVGKANVPERIIVENTVHEYKVSVVVAQ
jgi:hypothetical protein